MPTARCVTIGHVMTVIDASISPPPDHAQVDGDPREWVPINVHLEEVLHPSVVLLNLGVIEVRDAALARIVVEDLSSDNATPRIVVSRILVVEEYRLTWKRKIAESLVVGLTSLEATE